jgi:hypothetical protein
MLTRKTTMLRGASRCAQIALAMAIALAPMPGLALVQPGACVTEIISLNDSSDSGTLPGLAVPGYTTSPYDVVVMGVWQADGSANDALARWVSPTAHLSAADATALTGLPSPTDAEVRSAIRALDASAGVTRLVGAFYAVGSPVGSGFDAQTTALTLANFVTSHDLDGVLVAFEEDSSFNGIGEEWLRTLTNQLRSVLDPNATILHAPQAPYFAGTTFYPGGAYQTVHSIVGSEIDGYVVRYFNQGPSTYDTEQSLVFVSNGWALNTALEQIIASGVPASQLFVSKPATLLDASGSGYVDPSTLAAILDANPSSWGGVSAFQFASDEAAGFPFGSALCAAPAPPVPMTDPGWMMALVMALTVVAVASLATARSARSSCS